MTKRKVASGGRPYRWVSWEPDPRMWVCLVMQNALDLELIFPIRDRPSARLMGLKADCLCCAGIIGERERRWVEARIDAVVDPIDRKQAA